MPEQTHLFRDVEKCEHTGLHLLRVGFCIYSLWDLIRVSQIWLMWWQLTCSPSYTITTTIPLLRVQEVRFSLLYQMRFKSMFSSSTQSAFLPGYYIKLQSNSCDSSCSVLLHRKKYWPEGKKKKIQTKTNPPKTWERMNTTGFVDQVLCL